MSKIEIKSAHLPRVEGHGNILVEIVDGRVEKCLWQVVEAPRFFEAMVRGSHFEDIQIIVSRICGICSITHSLAATKAIESAFGTVVSPQADALRILMHYSEQVQSHMLHIGYLALPDFFNTYSIIPIAGSRPDLAKKIIGLHRFANTWSNLVAGRQTHPVTIRPGGLTMIPRDSQLAQLKTDMLAALDQALSLTDLLCELKSKLPVLQRPSRYLSLIQDEPPTYTFYHGLFGSRDSGRFYPVESWPRIIHEYILEQSTAKWAHIDDQPYVAGARARFNNNSQLLSPAAKRVADLLGLTPPCHDPFLNTFAQFVEVIHLLESSVELIDGLLAAGLKDEPVHIKPCASAGSGCVEAPRGILFHSYEFDEKGICTGANCCIPTSQNHASIQKDIESFVPANLHLGPDALKLALEMLVRSYDPCISCSTHMVSLRYR